MAGAACKVVINNGIKALTESLERILIDPNVHQDRLPEDVRLDLIQRMADVDLSTYSGCLMPPGGLTGVMVELERHGLVTAEVWEVYARPVTTTSEQDEKAKKDKNK